MRCNICKRDISKPIVFEYRYPDGHIEVTSELDNTTASPGGSIHLAYHRKCWKGRRKTGLRAADPLNVTGKGDGLTSSQLLAASQRSDEARESGTAAEVDTRQMTEGAAARARARMEQIRIDRENDTGYVDRTERMDWPAGGQVDAEI